MEEADFYLHFAEIDDQIIKAFAPLFLMSISYSVKTQKPLFLLNHCGKNVTVIASGSGQTIVFIELVGRVSKKRIGSLERAA